MKTELVREISDGSFAVRKKNYTGLAFLLIFLLCIAFNSNTEGVKWRDIKDESPNISASAKVVAANNAVVDNSHIQNNVERTHDNEVSLHESSHLVVYIRSMQENDYTPHPVEVSIIPSKKNNGHFSAEGFWDYETGILTNYAGYASRVVFFSENPMRVFAEIKTKKYTDYIENTKLGRQGRKVSEYDDFLAAVEWVRKYRQEILTFSERLKKERLIKF